jgi:murein DD-endopeptidase MepM/ murein hydrolase activator NlpD
MRSWSLPLIAFCALGLAACRADTPPAPPPRAAADIVLEPNTELIRGVVPPRTTLDALLRSHGVGTDGVASVIAAARKVFDPRRLRATQPFSLIRTPGGKVRAFEYEIDDATFLRIERPAPGAELRPALVPIPRERRDVVVAGTIDSDTPSLFQAMDAAGETPDLSIALAEIFSGEVDFNTELQPGDRFGLAVEKFVRAERPATYGDVAAAELHNDGRVMRAIRFTPPSGKAGYYDENGRSLRRFFLRSPLKFEPRITSGFSRRRFHPVLHTYRAHLGVDYGAPTGAPVVAVSNGTVLSATFDRANGRMIRLAHAGGYETYYLHLSAFAPGIRRGARVSQGQVIGRVGSTGLASGPHLDYRLRKNGTFVNPMLEHRRMPPGEPVPAAAMAEFARVRDAALSRLMPAVTTATAAP